jgi:hypothetical protein
VFLLSGRNLAPLSLDPRKSQNFRDNSTRERTKVGELAVTRGFLEIPLQFNQTLPLGNSFKREDSAPHQIAPFAGAKGQPDTGPREC